MPFVEVNPVCDKQIPKLCVKRYPNHPRGCPNFGKKKGCPPTKFWSDIYSGREVWAIYNVFDFKSHTSKMRKKHPDWTDRQIECCLYWQGTARKKLKEEVQKFLISKKLNLLNDGVGYEIVSCPEALGVNITKTLKDIGIVLEWPPKNITYQVVFAVKKQKGT